MAKTFFLPIAFVLLAAGSAAAQTSTPQRPATRVPAPPPSVIPGDQESSHIPEEMRIKMEIARADEEYKKTLEDADKLSLLSTEVTAAFHGAGKLAGDDLKKLGTIEKLAKRILTQAGGDEVGDHSGELQSKPLNDALDQLSAAADRVQKCIKEQTRFVVSATVISNTNDIIHLAQHIRRIAKVN
jgi:hypothetical protein